MKRRNSAHGGAREGAGRPPAEDKASHPVMFRLTSAELEAAQAAARRAGYETVHAFAKAVLVGTVSR